MKDNRKLITEYSLRFSYISFSCYLSSIPTRSKTCQVQTEQNAEMRNLYSFSREYHKMKEEKKTSE